MGSRTSVGTLFLCGAVGVLFGWGASVLRSCGVSDSADDVPGEGPGEVRRVSRPSRAGLASKAGPVSGDSPLARRLASALEGDRAESLAKAARGEEGGSPRGVRGWSALLTLYALADQAEDFLRSAPDALLAGVEVGAVLDLVRLFPVAHRADLLQRLVAGTSGAAWPAGEVADVYVEAGDAERAMASLAGALEVAPHRALIDRLVRIDPERAAALLKRLAADKAWDTRRLQQIGDELVASAHPELSVAFFQAALEKEPLDRGALDRLAGAAPALALAYARGLTQAHGENPAAWLSLGAMELKAGTPQVAFDAYRQAASRALTKDALYGLLKADPQRAYATAAEFLTPQADDETLGVVACLALAGDRPGESMEALLRAHERDPSDYKWNAALVDLDSRRALEVLASTAESYRGKRRDEVVGAYGDALLETGDSRRAYDRYREAFDLDPADGAWLAGLARADAARALPLLEARRRAVGDNVDLLGALADAYAGSGRREEARALYEQAARGDGGLKWYGRMALVDPAGARARLDEAIARNPKSDEAWGALGDYQRALGNAAAAREAYARARELDPSNLTWEARARAADARAK